MKLLYKVWIYFKELSNYLDHYLSKARMTSRKETWMSRQTK